MFGVGFFLLCNQYGDFHVVQLLVKTAWAVLLSHPCVVLKRP